MHFGPHDLAVHEYTTAQTRLDTAKQMGFKFRIVGKHFVNDGIDAVRGGLDYTVIHSQYCRQGWNLLKMYRKDLVTGKPVHDVSSHCADALRYFYVGYKQYMSEPAQGNRDYTARRR